MEMKLVIRDIAKTGNIIYLVPRYLNGIITVDLATCMTHFISIREKGHRVGQDLYEDILVSDGLIWCSPCMENQIAVYDSSMLKFKYLPLPELPERGRNFFRCGKLIEIGEDIIVLPLEYPGIVKVDKSDFDLKVIEWKEKLYQKEKKTFIERMSALAKDYEVVDDEIYLLDSNYILKYNYVDDSIRYINICSEYKNFVGIVRFNNRFILIDRLHAELFEWREEDNNLVKLNVDLGYDGSDTDNEEGDGCPIGLIQIKDKIAIMLAVSNYLYLLDKEYRIEKIELDVQDIEQYGVKWHYFCYEFDGRNLYFPICCENKILVIDTDTWEQKSIEINMCLGDIENIFKNAMTAEKPICENSLFYSLEKFINELKNN